MSSEDLYELSRLIPEGFVERKAGNDYVAHHIINQRLLTVTGPFDWERVEIIRGDVPAVPPDPNGKSSRAKAGTPALTDVVVGVIYRLTVEIDGKVKRVEATGDVGDVHNWPHDGARMKDAESDALKRCAMRLGLGLHLWAQEHYFLEAQLKHKLAAEATGADPETGEVLDGQAAEHAAELAAAAAEPADGTAHPDGTFTPAADAPPEPEPFDPDVRPVWMDDFPMDDTPPPAEDGTPKLAPEPKQEKPKRQRAAKPTPAPEPTPEPEATTSPDTSPAEIAADKATTMSELLEALKRWNPDVRPNGLWLAIVKAKRAGKLPPEFPLPRDVKEVLAYDGPRFDIAKAWLIDQAKAQASVPA